MITKVTSAIKDHWRDWDDKFVPAPQFDVAAYQEKLDEIAGKSRGKSILKLEWGGDASVTRFTSWDSSGRPTAASIQPRFAIPRRHPILEYEQYIPIRRWIITERQEPEQSRPDDNFDNTFTDEYGAVCQAGEKRAETYWPYIYVGDHSKCPADCCKDRLCLGDYKVPDQAELNYILEITYKLHKEFYADPYKPLDDATMARIKQEYADQIEKQRQSTQNEFDDESRDWWNAHRHRIESDDPSVHSHGRFHFLKENPLAKDK